MASNAFVVFMMFASVVVVATNVAGVDYLVGDDKGWTINFDYQEWALGKEFRVGDRLVFKYPEGYHNVIKVNGTNFKACIVPPLTQPLTSGYDVIYLSTPGRKWYISGVGHDCVNGQKLFINVSLFNWSPPSPSIAFPPISWAPIPAPSPSPCNE